MNDSIGKTFSLISTIFSLILPVTQLLLILTRDDPLLFLDSNAIVPVSIITLVTSFLIILLSYSFPYIRFTLNKKAENEYLNFLRETDPRIKKIEEINKIKIVSPPFYITLDIIVIFSIIFSIFSGFSFIAIGLTIKEPTTIWIITQSLCYLLFIVTSSFVIFNLLYKQKRLNQWKILKSERAKKAINLAIEYGSIDEFPPTRIMLVNETQSFPKYLQVFFKVNDQEYRVTTDAEAIEFIELTKIIPPAKQE